MREQQVHPPERRHMHPRPGPDAAATAGADDSFDGVTCIPTETRDLAWYVVSFRDAPAGALNLFLRVGLGLEWVRVASWDLDAETASLLSKHRKEVHAAITQLRRTALRFYS